jgi:hypothetical protein
MPQRGYRAQPRVEWHEDKEIFGTVFAPEGLPDSAQGEWREDKGGLGWFSPEKGRWNPTQAGSLCYISLSAWLPLVRGPPGRCF